MEDHQDSGPEIPIQPEREPAGPKQKEGFIATARRALSHTVAEIREGIASLDVREKQVPLEEITERAVAERIDRSLFDVTTILTNLGYFSANHKGYQQAYPDAYRLSRIALLGLKRQGILDIRFDEEGANVHGEDMLYDVNEEKLQEYLRQPTNGKNN